MKQSIRYIYGDFQEKELPALHLREIRIEPVQGKALTFIGMRRVGKTYLCYQIIKRLINEGVPKENILYINFEDDRLYGFKLEDCQSMLDIFYEHNSDKKSTLCYFFFDEIQNVPNWERFVRRVLDTEKAEIYLTGSSANLLSKEIATQLRGRSLSREVFPFSYTEFIEAKGKRVNLSQYGSHNRMLIHQLVLEYIDVGGLPECFGKPQHLRIEIIQSYVDAVILRDIVERYGLSNIETLRTLVYHLLRNPACRFSIHKFYNDLKSRGFKISKDDLYLFLRYLEDAFLIFSMPIWSTSEKKKQVNPKKIYILDTGIIQAYKTGFTQDNGALLENLVYITLRKKQIQSGYYITAKGNEVDFACLVDDGLTLIQVAWNLEDPSTREREFRSLYEAKQENPSAKCLLVTLNEEGEDETGMIRILPVWKFLTEFSQSTLLNVL